MKPRQQLLGTRRLRDAIAEMTKYFIDFDMLVLGSLVSTRFLRGFACSICENLKYPPTGRVGRLNSEGRAEQIELVVIRMPLSSLGSTLGVLYLSECVGTS